MRASPSALVENMRQQPWIYSFIGALAVWLLTLSLSGGVGAVQSLQAAMNFAMFFAIVGLGQMFVISAGPGNIDLSIPSVMTLAGLLAMSVMQQNDAMVLPGLALALAVGAVIGAANYVLIILLHIPPIVATLAMSFIVQSTAIYAGGAATMKPPAIFIAIAMSRFFGIPILPAIMAIVAGLMVVVLRRTLFGRGLLAVGQSAQAAWLAGIDSNRIRLYVYVLCGFMAALAGVLLAAFSGGASLDIGSQYQLVSIAVVVIGGTSVLGGRAYPQGVWGAALFLYVLINLLNLAVVRFGLGTAGPGIRLILTGLMIVAIVAIARQPD
ncbi:ABC transporter permease [Ensifer sp. YR511]|uniref:ABC transporter permease n=1 Tax=Ensifer sp. YR511 TaxID=1855294 RepID=UPI00088FE79C|nr:ABC transporter permease [Ensifer sp. YR511]SDO07565.1 ribose transport system permease protein [Ensifer sp. YR511]